MADKEDSTIEQYKSKRAILLDYLEHAGNVIVKKITETAIPEGPAKADDKSEKTAAEKAVVSDSPFIGEQPIEAEKVIMEVPIQAPEIKINSSEIDNLLYLREKRDLLESVLLKDGVKKRDKILPQESEIKAEIVVEVKPAETAVVDQAPKTEPPLRKEIRPIAENIPKKLVDEPKQEMKTETICLAKIIRQLKIDWVAHLQVRKNKIKKILHRRSIRRFARKARRISYGSATIALGFYLGYLLLVYSFTAHNAWFEQVAGQLLAPALISNYGLVDYYSYQHIKSTATNLESGDTPTLLTLKWQIINSLADKYGLDKSLDRNLLMEVLKRRVASDSSLNYHGARTLLELKKSVRRGDNIEKTAEATGLTIHRKTYTKKFAAQQFGGLIYGLRTSSLSPVIINNQGIYVLSILSSSETKMEFNYLFVPIKTLDKLIKEKLAEGWIVSLVD